MNCVWSDHIYHKVLVFIILRDSSWGSVFVFDVKLRLALFVFNIFI